MTNLFLACAVFGTAVLAIQFVITAIGLDWDDIEPDPDASWFFSVLSLKSLVAAVAFFGLGGLTASGFGASAYLSILSGLVAAAFAMVLVTWLMHLLHDLRSDGTVDIENAVGLTGEVYLSIPAAGSGIGKVTVGVQNRSMEYKAVTDGDALPTGTPVVVVDIPASDTLKVTAVAPATEEKEESRGV